MVLQLELWKKPKGVSIIEGFPGFGLVGPITTEFLIDHLQMELIGQFKYEHLPATIAIHDGKVVNPMAVYYSEKYNLVIFHTILNVKGHEWHFADKIAQAADELKAKEVISLEGVNVLDEKGEELYCFGNPEFVKLGAIEMKESIIMGVSAALLLRVKEASCLFAQAQSTLPDSKAAANMIAFLDKYFGLVVNPAPLLQQAAQFEEKLKTLMAQSSQAEQQADTKNLSYLG